MTGVLHKIKRPGGVHAYEFASDEEDAFGHWLHLPRGAGWTAPHDRGVLPFDVLVLLTPGAPLVAWWCDDPTDRRIEVDVCMPPREMDSGWSFVDLELDVVLHADSSLVVEDEDEFVDTCLAGYIREDDAALARAACADAVAMLANRREPFDQRGWRHLSSQ